MGLKLGQKLIFQPFLGFCRISGRDACRDIKSGLRDIKSGRTSNLVATSGRDIRSGRDVKSDVATSISGQ